MHPNVIRVCEPLRSTEEFLNAVEWLAGLVLPKKVLGIFLMLRLSHFVGSCKTDTFTSMSNGKQKNSAQCRQSFHVASFKAVYSHGDIFQAKLHSQKTRLCLAALLM